MRKFTTHQGLVVPLDRANVDTDQIIPKQFLKSIRRTGFGENLFDAWRFLDEGAIGRTPNERQIDRRFVLNDARYQGGSILLARENFGCGSSREHAVWALDEYGFRAVIAPSFADIFKSNCYQNGLVPIVLDAESVSELFELAASSPGFQLTIDLPNQRVQWPSGKSVPFEIDPHSKARLVDGLDEIALTLKHEQDIRAFEARQRIAQPWLYARD